VGRSDDEMGFYARALEEARAVERPKDDEGADELAALQGRLLRALRRQPGDVWALMRHAESLSRMAVAAHRMSPRASKDLSDNLAAVLNRFGDLIVPADK
jgi:hypothetical protein